MQNPGSAGILHSVGCSPYLSDVQVGAAVVQRLRGGRIEGPLSDGFVLGRCGSHQSNERDAFPGANGQVRRVLDVWIKDDEYALLVSANPQRARADNVANHNLFERRAAADRILRE